MGGGGGMFSQPYPGAMFCGGMGGGGGMFGQLGGSMVAEGGRMFGQPQQMFGGGAGGGMYAQPQQQYHQ